MEEVNKVYLCLGSNQGDREGYLVSAIDKISGISNVNVEKVSFLYATEPVGYVEQEDFLNCVIRIDTDLEPHDLLGQTQQIEKDLKRERKIHWGPRTIDIDILMYKNVNMDSVVKQDLELTLPHKEMLNRAFVLKPLIDVLENDELKKMFRCHLDRVKEQRVEKYNGGYHGRGLHLFGE